MYYTRKNYYQMKDDKEYKVYVIRPILDDEEYTKKNKFNYYGSTTKHIDERYGQHKGYFKSNSKKIKSYLVFEKYGIDNIECVILNRFDNEEDMKKQEILYINHNENCVNSVYKHTYYETNEESITRINRQKEKEKEKELIKLNKIKEQQIKENNLTEKERKIIKRKQIKKQKKKEEKEANKTMNKRFCK